MFVAKTIGLFVATAVCEIVGCYLPYLWLRHDRSAWLLAPAALSLALFAWLLTLHPQAAGRTYASYGGVYVATALFWLWLVDHQRPDRWDLLGGAIAIVGMAIIAFGPRAPMSAQPADQTQTSPGAVSSPPASPVLTTPRGSMISA